MRNTLRTRIMRHLDSTLGRWTRIMPWREELTDHLEESWTSKLSSGISSENAWSQTLQEFGDLSTVHKSLLQEHTPRELGLRALVALIAIGYIFWSIDSISIFCNYEALALLLIPVCAGIIGIMLTNRMRVRSIERMIRLSLAGGCLAGLAIVCLEYDNPSQVGGGLALCVLCALYGLIALPTGKWLMMLFGAAIIAAFGVATWVLCGHIRLNPLSIETAAFTQYMIYLLIAAGIAWARWGSFQWIARLPRIMLAALVLQMVFMLVNVESVERMLSEFALVAFVVLACQIAQVETTRRLA